jgi:hypothetical protein
VNIITPIRELWRRRLLVGVAGILALLIGVMVAYSASLMPPKLEKRAYTVGVASSRVFVDTPASQVVEVNPRGSDTLAARAQVLSNVMTEGVVKASIAKVAGLRPEQLVATSDAAIGAPSADASAADKPSAYLLETHVVTNTAGEHLPIIEIETQAPNAKAAATLASAAMKGLNQYLDQRATVEDVPAAKRLRVDGLGSPETRQVTRGPGLLLGLTVMLFSFLAGCGLILAGLTLVRGWREADASERLEDADWLPSAQELGEPVGQPHLLSSAGREREAG